jgi:putative copper resistance protein D
VEADPLAPLLFVIKLGLYGSALLAAGLALHATVNIVARADYSRAMRSATLAGVVALFFAGLRLGLANVQLGGGNALLDPATLSWTWPALGQSLAATASGAVALATGWWLRSGIAAGIGAVALAIPFGLTGHNQALDSPGLAPWAVALHILIAAFWLAGPITLWPTRKLEDAALIRRMTRFSDLTVAAVPLLFLLGLWLALLLAGGWTPLLTSLYGQLLLAKLGAASFALDAITPRARSRTARAQTDAWSRRGSFSDCALRHRRGDQLDGSAVALEFPLGGPVGTQPVGVRA